MLTRKTLETLLKLYRELTCRAFSLSADNKDADEEYELADGVKVCILDLCCGPEPKEADNGE